MTISLRLPRRRNASPRLLAIGLLLLAGCQAPAVAPSTSASSVGAEPTPETSSPSSATPSATTASSPSAAAEACLTEEVVAALDDLDSGVVDTDPPRADIAEALDGLELEGREDELRNSLVDVLSADAPDEFDVRLVATALQAEVLFQEC